MFEYTHKLLLKYFNQRTREECDINPERISVNVKYISINAPVKSATDFWRLEKADKIISINAPVKSATH